jgi:predicted NACHT family NTPase
LLILLDGLDEVPTKNLNEAIAQIQNFVDQYDKNRFIASCRTAAYRSGFRRFSDVAMADFDDTQIEQFIGNWFQSEADKQAGTAQKCWEILQKPEYKAAKELAQTPLLLTFLCLVYDRSQSFPDNRSVLYRKALRILLENGHQKSEFCEMKFIKDCIQN